MTALTRSPKYRVFQEDRAKTVHVHLRESITSASGVTTISDLDVSAGTVLVYFRAYLDPPTTSADYLVDTTMTKQSGTVSDGDTGIVKEDITFTAAHRQVTCEVVVVDTAVTSQPTPTTYQERVWKRWTATVDASVQP